jgi:hypothetical protein
MKVKVTKQQRRGTVRWVADWRDRSDKRHQPQFPTKEAAEAEAERIRETLRAQRGRTPELPEAITWTGLFERVMADRGDLKPRTLESYRTMHRLYLAPAFGATPVVKLTRSQLREFLRRHLTQVRHEHRPPHRGNAPCRPRGSHRRWPDSRQPVRGSPEKAEAHAQEGRPHGCHEEEGHDATAA